MTGLIIFGTLCIMIIISYMVSLKTKNYHLKFNLLSKMILLLILLLLILINVLTFGFRYYLFLVVLIIIITRNALNIFRETKVIKKFSIIILTRRTIGILLLLFIGVLPAIIFPEYELLPTTGIYQVEVENLTFIDSNRIEGFNDENEYRNVNLRIIYPKDTQESFPLVIYSHGGISLDTSNESLCLELASQGYVVISLGHPYHSLLTKSQQGENIWINQDYMKELNSENAIENAHESFELYQKWMKLRTDDISFVIDYLKEDIEFEDENSLYQLIDITNIAVIGHSLGGSAALCIGRLRTDISAVVALESPYMCDIIGVDNNDFLFVETIYPVPVLNIYSDSSWDNLSVWPQYKQNYRYLNDSNFVGFNHRIDGVGHFSLTDLSLSSQLLTRMLNGFKTSYEPKEVLEEINLYSLEFLDKHLKSVF